MNAPPRSPSPPIIPAIHGLWSLWDMLDKYGLRFAKALSWLADAKVLCFPMKLPKGQRAPTNQEISTGVAIGLDLIKEAYDACGMTGLAPELDRIAILTGRDTFAPRSGISQAIVHLISRVKDDLAAQYFYHLAGDNVRFYGQHKLFGELVAGKFKKAAEDIKNAGNCLALDQPTACVFHLMRAMEVAVRQLARRPQMSITITPNTTWRQITGAMDDKIKKMLQATAMQKRKKENWEEARANLHHVGDVWRNSTMHPAKTYSPSQARDIFNACRVFMGGLCAL